MSTTAWKPGSGPRGPVPGAGGRLLRRVLGRPEESQPQGLSAVFWDMDGLLVDSEPLWTVAEVELAQHFGGTWTDEIKAACIGKRLDASVPVMLDGLGVPKTGENLAFASASLLTRVSELFLDQLPVLPGARELLAACADAGIPCALVSSSFRVLVDACLAGLGDGHFAVSIAGDELEHAKPHPQPYRMAAARLGVDPARCVVLEDSVTGARAGLAAGCATVLVPGDTVPPPAENLGWTQVGSLGDLTPDRLRALVR